MYVSYIICFRKTLDFRKYKKKIKTILKLDETWCLFSLPEKYFGSISLKIQKSRYQSFLVLSNFTWLFYLLPNILFRIVGIKFLYSELSIYTKTRLPTWASIHKIAHSSLFLFKTKQKHKFLDFCISICLGKISCDLEKTIFCFRKKK